MTWRRVPKRPTWWLMYSIGVLWAAALVAVEITVPHGAVRSALQIAIIVVGVVLVRFWLFYNRGAIEYDRWRATRQQTSLVIVRDDEGPERRDGRVRARSELQPAPDTSNESGGRQRSSGRV